MNLAVYPAASAIKDSRYHYSRQADSKTAWHQLESPDLYKTRETFSWPHVRFFASRFELPLRQTALRRFAPQGLRLFVTNQALRPIVPPVSFLLVVETFHYLYNTCMHFTYILRCADDMLYVGCTNNLERRLNQHNNSKYGAHYTKIRRPVIMIYHETFPTLKEARKREAEIKGWKREKKIGLVKKSFIR